MSHLLLDSRFSDYFSLGTAEEYIPTELANRIIRLNSKIKGHRFSNLTDYLEKYEHLGEDPRNHARIISEYWLNDFLEEIRRNEYFDNFIYFEGKEGEIFEYNGFHYRFMDGGRRINISANNKILTEIFRVIDIRKKGDSHVIICDPRFGRKKKSKIKDRSLKKSLIKPLVGKSSIISYLKVFPLDMAIKGLLEQECLLKNFLREDETNLAVIYSAHSNSIYNIGGYVREWMEFLYQAS